jgi:hypothetical protein
VLLLWLALVGLTSGAVLLGRFTSSPVISFADYMGIMPESHKSALKGFLSTCYWGFESFSHPKTCKFITADDMFFSGEVRIYNDKIQELHLFAEENQLRVGDLILLLGTPTHVYHFYEAIHFIWYYRDRVIGVRIPHVHNSFMLPVSKVYFLNSMPPPSSNDHD